MPEKPGLNGGDACVGYQSCHFHAASHRPRSRLQSGLSLPYPPLLKAEGEAGCPGR
jgi:hypothetical protein